MPLQPLVPALILATTMSVVSMVWAVGAGARDVSFMAAIAFALVAIGATAFINRPVWKRSIAISLDEAAQTARRNAWMMTTVYAWGGFAMFAVYSLTDIWWWHSWQYGGAMLLIALGLLIHAYRMGQPTSQLRSPTALTTGAVLALLQGLGALGALGFLIATGKLASLRADWPANHVFFAGGIAIVALSAIAVFTHSKFRPAT